MSALSSWEAFVRTVETGSMAAAARRMNCSRAQVSKLLGELEQGFGVRLLERNTRRLHLTPAGEVFHQHALRTLEAVRDTERAVQDMVETPCGVLRVSASVSFGRMHVAPLLPQIAERYPQLQCELILSDDLTDLFDENIDVAIRLTINPPQAMVARRLAYLRRVICASPGYLAAKGEPREARDLLAHQCFQYALGRAPGDWRLNGPEGEICIPVQGSFQVNNTDCVLEAALRGHGIAILPTYLCAQHLASGALRSVLDAYKPLTPFGQHAYACYAASRARLPRLRVFLDALSQHFSPTPPWERG